MRPSGFNQRAIDSRGLMQPAGRSVRRPTSGRSASCLAVDKNRKNSFAVLGTDCRLSVGPSARYRGTGHLYSGPVLQASEDALWLIRDYKANRAPEAKTISRPGFASFPRAKPPDRRSQCRAGQDDEHGCSNAAGDMDVERRRAERRRHRRYYLEAAA